MLQKQSSLKSYKIVAAFDFDKTLTDRDMFFRFMAFVTPMWKFPFLCLTLVPSLLVYAMGKKTRTQMKEKVITTFLKGFSVEDMQQLGNFYAQTRLPATERTVALQKVKWHQTQGHLCVLISAGLPFYLEPWAKKIGFDHVIATQLEVSSTGRLTGRLQGGNCWGEEKTRRLEQLLGPKSTFILYAYGDSEGDAALLKMADHPFYRCWS